MSKRKAKKTHSSAKTHQPTSKTKNKAKSKKKYRCEKTKRVSVDQGQPPKAAQLFSANWKALQEMLKSRQTEKKQQPAPSQQQNGALQSEGAKADRSKHISKNKAGPQQMDSRKNIKHKTVSNSVVSKDSHVSVNVTAVSEARQPAAPKRKKDVENSNSNQAAKKKKSVVEETKPTEEDLWFDDVDPDDVEATIGAEAAEIMRKKQGIQKSNNTCSALVRESAFDGLTKAVAIDCEMVGVGPDGEDSMLARVSIVNYFGKCIYDKFVKPTEKVTDYRTAVSGIRPEDIKNGEDVRTVQREVAEILQGRTVVGHAIHNDLKVLLLDHPKKKIRDTQKYKPFKKAVKSGRPSLKLLCREILNVKVQQGEHSSVQDAQATMRLYTLVKIRWEAEIRASQKNKDSVTKCKRKPKLPKNQGKNLMGL